MSSLEEGEILRVRATGKRSLQVVVVMRAPETSISYFVPGSSCTRLPRHSRLRASYQSGKPSRHAESPAFLNLTGQSFGEEGVQYRPIDSKVGTARSGAPTFES